MSENGEKARETETKNGGRKRERLRQLTTIIIIIIIYSYLRKILKRETIQSKDRISVGEHLKNEQIVLKMQALELNHSCNLKRYLIPHSMRD